MTCQLAFAPTRSLITPLTIVITILGRGPASGERITDEDACVPRVWPASPEYADRWGTAGPGEDLFALWHRTPPESGLWVPAPV